MDENELVRVAEFFNRIDIGLAKGVLADKRIFAVIEGEHFADLGLTVTGPGSELYLQVRRADLAQAISCLEVMTMEKRLLIHNA